ncbi:flagellar motor switch phosphatase FliY [Clostridium sp. Cult2]|uniref:flagellar motor switch phosphatase FliY n=1 Tax=Clostridium sp. Cult2 TaxID=2079003 RepID=UPI001F00E43E|nr:flagellar motor switch phosphatase FliY [Clostridium sp. Cult2]MCF6466302.1 flagellar motor switch phosphatase FliY [Clostridium sp. Cult2]
MNNDMLSQEEIDLLLKGTENLEKRDIMDEAINEIEKDTLGEIGNISMGTAATTLSTLLNKKVTITTPKVEVTTAGELSHEYPIPFVAVDVKYKSGFEGSNVLMIKSDDVKIITDIMMGNEEIDKGRELSDMDLSAISEVMNQMMGSSATSLSEIFLKRIDIEPPKSYEITFSEGSEKLDILRASAPIIKVSFKMVVEDLIDSEIMQLIPLDFGQEMVESLLGNSSPIFDADDEITEVDSSTMGELDIDLQSKTVKETPKAEKHYEKEEKEHVIIKKPEFETFDTVDDVSYNESIDLVGDIPVELTAELGRTIKKISEILEYGPGTVIELDKLVGEPLDIYANGKFIAKGEVVVIDDNFGIRITDVSNSYGD